MKLNYLLSGGIACLINLLTLAFAEYVVHLKSSFSSFIGYAIGAFTNYLLLYYWTFTPSKSLIQVAPKYGMVLFLSSLLNTSLFTLLYPSLGSIGGQAIALTLIIPINFFINRHVTFA